MYVAACFYGKLLGCADQNVSVREETVCVRMTGSTYLNTDATFQLPAGDVPDRFQCCRLASMAYELRCDVCASCSSV